MKSCIIFILLVSFSFGNCVAANAAPPGKGFNYKAHKKMNQKANRWGKKRMKAAKYDLTNVKCSSEDSRKYSNRHR